MDETIISAIKEHKQAVSFLENNRQKIEEIVYLCLAALKNKGKIIFMGNGGSAADAQHLAAELVGRFKKNRPALAALALTTDTSILTAVGNDFGFKEIFSRQIEALSASVDIAVCLSTSGVSENIIKAVKTAQARGIKTIGFLGKDGGVLAKLVDIPLVIPFFDTARIQEAHILAGHIVCELIENYFFAKIESK